MRLDQNSSIPLYEQLKNDIKRDIRSGYFPAGSRMPSEDELEKKYSVSRITVRRAVKELCAEEYLVKKQGKGTFVLDNSSLPVTISQGFHDIWERKGKKVTVEIVENKVINLEGEYRELLNLTASDEVIFLKRVLKADDEPMMIDVAYIPLKLYPNLQMLLGQDDSIYRLLRKLFCLICSKSHMMQSAARFIFLSAIPEEKMCLMSSQALKMMMERTADSNGECRTISAVQQQRFRLQLPCL